MRFWQRFLAMGIACFWVGLAFAGREEVERDLALLQSLYPRITLDPAHVFARQDKLGSGAYGVVYRVRLGGDETYAFKLYRYSLSSAPWADEYVCMVENFLKEISVMHLVRGSPYLMGALAYLPPDGVRPPGILMPLMRENLASLMTRFPDGLPRPTLKKMLLGITRALHDLHSNHITHCDLKPQNVLLGRGLQPYLSDFDSVNSQERAVCTLWFRAPEWALGAEYDAAADMFSFGCLAFNLVTGRYLFQTDSEIGHLFETFQISGTPSDGRAGSDGQARAVHWPAAVSAPDYSPDFPYWLDRRVPRLTELIREDRRDYVELVASLIALDPRARPSARDVEVRLDSIDPPDVIPEAASAVPSLPALPSHSAVLALPSSSAVSVLPSLPALPSSSAAVAAAAEDLRVEGGASGAATRDSGTSFEEE